MPKRLISSYFRNPYPLLVKWIFAWLLVTARLIAAPLTVATYNLEFYVDTPVMGVPPKSPEARALIRESIRRLNPDVLAMQEMGSTNALGELINSLRAEKLNFPFIDYVKGPDSNLHLAFLSKRPIIARRPHTNESFLFQGKRHQVSRGFAEIDVQVGKQLITFLSAHLKSKRQVGEADQQGLREEEAKLLRERIDDFFQREPNGNFIVLGDFNDDIGSRTLKTIVGRNRTRLFDPRPCERNGDTMANPNPRYEPRRILWTHYFAKEETYSRLDYILLSGSLRSAVDPAETYVLAMPNWGTASDHRPVCVRLNLAD
jgi:endonuclease/exonuclease/phosphatase family metal-dependent hydrolase